MTEDQMDARLALRFSNKLSEDSFVLIAPEKGKPLWEYADGKILCRFHSGQVRAWESTANVPAALAGTQGGKTTFGVLWFLREILRSGAGSYIIATPVFPLLNLQLLPEFKLLFQETLKLGEYKAADKVFIFSPESCSRLFGGESCKVHFGYAENPDSLESLSAKAAWCDEAGQDRFKLGSWEAINRRLATTGGRVLITTTPYNLGWLKTTIYDEWARGNERFHVIQFDSTENPAVDPNTVEQARTSMPGWKFDMFYRGIFTRPAGLIYDCFNDETQIIPRKPIPEHWNKFVGIDFGPNNTAAVAIAEEVNQTTGIKSGRLVIYGSYFPKVNREAFQHVPQIKRIAGEINYACGGAASEDEYRKAFSAAGMPVVRPPVSSVEVGIDCVYGAMSKNQLYVFSDLADVIDTIHGYSREVDEHGQPTEKIAEKSTWHLADSIRYILSKLRPPQGKIRASSRVQTEPEEDEDDELI